MLYLEDYIEMIEHLPSELKMRFGDMRKIDENVQKMLTEIEDRQKTFFGSCRKLRPPERDDEFNSIRSDFQKVIEDSNDKVQIAEETYGLLDKYLRKLDKDLGDFKLELEADNRGITEILEKNSLEMDQPTLNSYKENRVPKKSRKHTSSLFNGSGGHIKSERSGSLYPSGISDSLLPGSLNPSLPIYGGAHASSSPNPFANLEPFAIAASQAIAATQQFGGARRATIPKSNLDSFVNFAQEFGGSSTLSGTDTPTSVGSPSSAPSQKRKKTHSRNASQSMGTPTSLLHDMDMNGTDSVIGHGGESFLDPDLGLRTDVNEPLYCICNQVSWGDMVACDNDECPHEWFHYSCVGISTPPKGKWYCKPCIASLSKKKTIRKQ